MYYMLRIAILHVSVLQYMRGQVPKKYKGDTIRFTDLGIWYTYEFSDFRIKPYANINTWFTEEGHIYQGCPILDTYSLGAKISWKWIGITGNTTNVCSRQKGISLHLQ